MLYWDMIFKFITTYLIIQGIYICFSPGMVFGKAGDWIVDKLGWYAKPVVSCNICMASLWGGLIYFCWLGVDWQVIPWCFALAGFTYIMNQFLNK